MAQQDATEYERFMSIATCLARPCARRVSTTLLGIASLSALLVSQAHAHISVTSVEPRGGNNGDQKTGPCPDLPRGEAMEFEAGSTITLEWTETVDHPGVFIVSFDPDGDDFDGDGDGNFDFPASLGGNDAASGNGDLVLMEVPDNDDGVDHSAEVTLPDMACDNCTLQLMQNMGERTPTEMNATAHLYFRCIDVVLVGGEGGDGGGAGGMTGSMGGGGVGGSLAGGFGGMLVGMGGQAEPTPIGGGGMTLVAPGGMPGVPPVVTAPSPSPMPTTPAPVTPEPGAVPPTPVQMDPVSPTQPGGPDAVPTTSMSAAAMPSASGTAGASDGGGESGDDGGCTVSPNPKAGATAFGSLSLLALMMCLGRRRRSAA